MNLYFAVVPFEGCAILFVGFAGALTLAFSAPAKGVCELPIDGPVDCSGITAARNFVEVKLK